MKTKKLQQGLSVIEVILAAAIFMIFASGIAQAVIGGFAFNRLGEEQTVANQFASEGIEAMRSIKNRSFAGLVNSAGTGLIQSGGVWTFSGVNNQFGPNNKYTRVLSVSDVQRDGSGNIVASGGTVDSSTKKITSTVSWNAGPTRANSVVLNTYLTNFRASVTALGGLLIYGDGTTTPKYRSYDSSANTFGVESPTVASAIGRTFVMRTSPTKTEAIAGYVTGGGMLQIMCYDGSTWTNEWSVTVGGTGATRPFDISYETNSGKAVVLYGTNTAATNELAYRTKPGSSGCGSANWSAAANVDPVRTSGTVQWVKMAWDRRSSSNLMTAIWADSASDMSASVWSGTAWGNEPTSALSTTLQTVAVSQDIENFDVEYESVSGEVMVVWGIAVANNNNGVRYATCTGGTSGCTWTVNLIPPTFTDDATSLDISANPDSNEIAFASVGVNQSDLQIGYWSGSAWTNTANADTSCVTPSAGEKFVSTGWLVSGAISRSVIRYADQGSNAIDWYTGNAGTFIKETDVNQSPAPSGPVYYDVQMNPISKDQLMSLVSDGANDLFAKRLVMTATPTFTWSNSDGTLLTALLPQSVNSPFGFAFWRN